MLLLEPRQLLPQLAFFVSGIATAGFGPASPGGIGSDAGNYPALGTLHSRR